jgi:hypothetical protein
MGPEGELISVRRGLWQRYGAHYSFEGVYANRRRCASSRRLARLSSAGLSTPATRWAEHLTCSLREGVIVRVRATLHSPGRWLRVSSSFDGTRRKVVEAALVVRNERTGRPLAYLELDRAGRTKVWRGAGCKT